MLNIYTSRASCDSLSECLSAIARDLERIRKEPPCADPQVVLIVPAQFTLAAEETAFRTFRTKGFFDFHVMSGGRLTQAILKECGGPGCAPINTLGRTMLLRRIAARHKDELQAFGRVCSQTEFLKMAGDFIVQMKQNQWEADDLRTIREKAASKDPSGLLEKKLADMELFCRGYSEAMAGRFTDSEDLLHWAADKLPESAFAARTVFWYWGFYSFTERELDFMQALLGSSLGLNVCLTLDREEAADGEVFEAPRRAAAKLRARAARIGQACGVYAFRGAASGCSLPEDLSHLERNLFALPPAKYGEAPSHVRLAACSGPFTQAETIASEILTLVREKGYQYDEIAILTEDMAGQGAAIRRAAAQMGVPLFADEKRAVSHSPAVETAAALLRYAAGRRYARDLMLCLKPGLIPLPAMESPRDLELFENYCRQFHIHGERLQKPFRYGLRDYGEDGLAHLEEIRSQLAALLIPFTQAMEEAQTVRDKSTVFCSFLAETLGLPDRLQEEASRLAEDLLVDAAEEEGQIWGVITGLLDQCVELLGDDEMTLEEYAQLLVASFSDIKIGLLPQAQGRVLMGTLSRSLTSRCRALFVAGLNDGILPRDGSSEGILTQRELEEIAQMDSGEDRLYTLAKTDSVLRQENLFTIYTAFTAPSELLWAGYCLSDAEGSSLQPSSLAGQLTAMFPALKTEPDVENAASPEKDLALIQGEKAAKSRIAAAMRENLSETGRVSPFWKEVYDRLEDKDALREGLLFTNRAGALGPGLAKDLFTRGSYRLSPSRLEEFARCPFRHFVDYGLRPQELRDFGVSPIERGDLYHDCLKRVSDWLSEPAREQGLPMTHPASRWMTVTPEELEQKVRAFAHIARSETAEGVMNAGPREQYQADRITDVCVRFAQMMVLQARLGRIEDMRFESEFGEGRQLPPIRIETPSGTVRIEGKIDRLDMLASDSGAFAKVIDYKSGHNTFVREDAEKGLMLQLAVYLEAALQQEGAKPAGFFYYRIQSDLLEAGLSDLPADEISADLWDKLWKSYRMNGLFVDDPAILGGLDQNAASDGKSSVVNYRITKEGKPYQGSGGVSAEDFESFRAAFRGSLSQICGRLTEGDIAIAPRKRKNGSVDCAYCDYRSICTFDTAFPGNRYI